MKRNRKFAELLTQAIRLLAIQRDVSIKLVQDELGYAIGREGGTAIEYWRKGYVPHNPNDVILLISEIMKMYQSGPVVAIDEDWQTRIIRSVYDDSSETTEDN